MTPFPWILIAVGFVLALTPKWTRPDLFFAVTVQTDFAATAPARRILRRYWLEIALHTLIAIALTGLTEMDNGFSVLLSTGWLLFGSGWAVARAFRKTRSYAATPSPVREASLMSQRDTLAGGWPLALGPLFFIVFAGVYAWIFWDRLPDRIPVHWSLQGADRWVDRSALLVFGFLAPLAAFSAVFVLLWFALQRWSRNISATGARSRSESRFRRVVLWMLIVLQYVIVVPSIVLAFGVDVGAGVWPVISGLVAVVALILLIRMGQGGSRLVDQAEYQTPIGDRTPDDAWKWGLFYYNPDDPAMVVEKRFGLGYTLNFGHVWSWVLLIVLLVPIGMVIALSQR